MTHTPLYTLRTDTTGEETGLPELGGTVPENVQDTAAGNVEAMGPVLGVLINIAVGVAFALLAVTAVTVVTKLMLRRRPRFFSQLTTCFLPTAVAASMLAARIATGLSATDAGWLGWLELGLLIGLVCAMAWLLLRILSVVEHRVLEKYHVEGVEDRRNRKIQTQMRLIRRILAALIIVIAIAVILLTFPSVRALGAGLLASAGLLSVIAGLAVQSTLTNVFAGVQLAFTDAIRVGDVVVVDEIYGTIEDITLSYVVVKIWDGRRVIYPSSYFTSTPFENWTRTGSALSGTIEFEVDWRVPMGSLRARLRQLVESTPLWDGQDSSLQITEALGGMAKIRAVISARNSGDLWDLRCLVREDLINFMRAEHPEALPALRWMDKDLELDAALAVEQESVAPEATPPTAPVPTVPQPARTDQQDDAAQGGRQDGKEPPARRTALPHIRPKQDAVVESPDNAEDASTSKPSTDSVPLTVANEHSSVFTGSISAVQRNKEFAGPGEDAYDERSRRTAESTGQLPEVEDAAESDHDEDRHNMS